MNSILKAIDLRPFRVSHVDLDLPELQGSPTYIARHKCMRAAERVGASVIVEDTSLCFNALNGMPGCVPSPSIRFPPSFHLSLPPCIPAALPLFLPPSLAPSSLPTSIPTPGCIVHLVLAARSHFTRE